MIVHTETNAEVLRIASAHTRWRDFRNENQPHWDASINLIKNMIGRQESGREGERKEKAKRGRK
jgi:hypothetical protein